MSDRLSVHSEVSDALERRRPVVALESTVITHGLPFPRNLEAARALEAEVREGGAVPATVAVLDGRLRVGLEDEDLTRLAELGPAAAKLSRRDLAAALVSGRPGSTTVAATMIAARLAGIAVFATGGIGGVHRGAETTFDVSADLEELARTPVCVVSAGAKAVLDLPKTLEVLETRGVPVIGYGTDSFPAFYSRDSGLAVPQRLDDPAEVARLLQAHWRLGLDGGVIVAVPVPAAQELPRSEIEPTIVEALAAADAAGVTGKDVTPFLLDRLADLTGGRSVEANLALLMNNARVAAAIATAYAALSSPPPLPPRPNGPRLRF